VKAHRLAGLFPLLEGEELAALAADVKARGLVHPIILFEDKILDGRNRWAACKAAKVEPRTETYDGDDPVGYVVSANVKRRHLTESQLDMIGARIATLRDGQRQVGKLAEVPTQPETAKLLGVSERGIRSVDRGEVKVSDAANVARQPKETQHRAMAKKKTKKAKTLRHAAALVKREDDLAQSKATAESRPTITKADALDFMRSLEPESVDLLLTDPPYSTDVEDIAAFASKWVPLALSRVKPTGRAYIFTGAYPKELYAYLGVLLCAEGWTVGVPLVWTYRNALGPSPANGYKTNWQACFHVYRDESFPLNCPMLSELFTVQDVNAPDGRQGDRFHTWQKPDELAERLIVHGSRPGDIVLDPFAGTGTFPLAAIRLGREALGCEHNDEMLALARERGADVK
jgi:DNA modification methylase